MHNLLILEAKVQFSMKIKHLRSLTSNEDGNIDMILVAVTAGVMFAISIPIIYGVLGGLDTTSIDTNLEGTPAANATVHLTSSLNQFYTIGPIYLVVVAAVGIIAAILVLRRP